ncbi:MAG: hypothetical protein Q7R83_00305 [bacterium]|nr:hypothetical protein [bacterium]
MFARVIPLLRTPSGVDAFDYVIPKELDIKRGDLVSIPFRQSAAVGLVERVMTDSVVREKARAILSLQDGISFPESFVDLLTWTSERTFTSKPAVLKAWLRHLPKRPSKDSTADTPAIARRDGAGKLSSVWVKEYEARLIDEARASLAHGKRVLILVPWKTRVATYQAALPDALTLHSDVNDGTAYRAWRTFLKEKGTCLIATRLGAWLSPIADRVLLDEPENDDHKQDELAPRFDARFLAAWSATNGGTDVTSFGLTPPLHTGSTGPTIDTDLHIHTIEPQGKSLIPMIQADTLEEITNDEGPVVIIHSIKGWAARFVCRECGWRAACPACASPLRADTVKARCVHCGKQVDPPLVCPTCGNSDLGKTWPGIEKLKQAWIKHESKTNVDWRTLEIAELDRPFPDKALVVMTDAALLGGGGEDIRRQERQCIAFRRLANRVRAVGGVFSIQCEPTMAYAFSSWLTTDGLTAFQQTERESRRVFGYPPAKRVVKLLFTSSVDRRTAFEEALRKTGAELIRGPWAVLARTPSKEGRFAYHAVFAADTPESTLRGRLASFAKEAIIDLDPIAFFR